MTTSEEFDDPFLRHFQRDPLPDAGIRIILLTDLHDDRAEAMIAPLADHRAHGPGRRERVVASKTVSAWPTLTARPGRGDIAAGAGHDGREPWTGHTSIRCWRRSTTAITSSAGARTCPQAAARMAGAG